MKAIFSTSNQASSGAALYYSSTKKYLLKTLNDDELEFLNLNLQGYLKHLRTYKNSLLAHFTGVYTYDKYHILVMKNVFPERMDTKKDPKIILRRYDLKGSIINRDVREFYYFQSVGLIGNKIKNFFVLRNLVMQMWQMLKQKKC